MRASTPILSRTRHTFCASSCSDNSAMVVQRAAWRVEAWSASHSSKGTPSICKSRRRHWNKLALRSSSRSSSGSDDESRTCHCLQWCEITGCVTLGRRSNRLGQVEEIGKGVKARAAEMQPRTQRTRLALSMAKAVDTPSIKCFDSCLD